MPASTAEVLEIFRLIVNGAHEGAKAKLEPARQNFIAQWVHRADGLAAERVAKLGLQVAQINIRTAH